MPFLNWSGFWMYTRQKQSSGGPEDMPFLNWSDFLELSLMVFRFKSL